METTRRTFFAALTSSVAALVAIAKGNTTETKTPGKYRQEIGRPSGKHGLQFTANSDVRCGEMVYLSSNGKVSLARRDPCVPIGYAINNAEPNGIVTVYFD